MCVCICLVLGAVSLAHPSMLVLVKTCPNEWDVGRARVDCIEMNDKKYVDMHMRTTYVSSKV